MAAPLAVPSIMLASSLAMLHIRQMFAASETHCAATFPATYLLLSGTAPIRRLLIIIHSASNIVRYN